MSYALKHQSREDTRVNATAEQSISPNQSFACLEKKTTSPFFLIHRILYLYQGWIQDLCWGVGGILRVGCAPLNKQGGLRMCCKLPHWALGRKSQPVLHFGLQKSVHVILKQVIECN